MSHVTWGTWGGSCESFDVGWGESCDVDTFVMSFQLQEEYLKMLTSAGIFDKEVAFNVLEIEISQSACRILLGCLASGNNEVRV